MSRAELPARRNTIRQHVSIGGRKLYLDVGLYDDGTPGEVFIVVDKTGAEQRWFYDEVARLASKLIQHGCPLDEVAQNWVGTRGRICGTVSGDDLIKHATSVLDYIGRYLLVRYCGRDDLAHVKRRN